jgi:hypothetical protein
MSIEAWLVVVVAIFTTLCGIIGTLLMLGYKDISRRIETLEHQDAKLYAATMTLCVAKSDDAAAIATAMHGLLTNGVKHD